MDSLNLDNNVLSKQLDAAVSAKPAGGLKDDTQNAGDMLGTFGDLLKQSMNQVNKSQIDAEKAAETYALGGEIQLHQVMIQMEKAELSMELASQVRNKMVAAYQEISRMAL